MPDFFVCNMVQVHNGTILKQETLRLLRRHMKWINHEVLDCCGGYLTMGPTVHWCLTSVDYFGDIFVIKLFMVKYQNPTYIWPPNIL